MDSYNNWQDRPEDRHRDNRLPNESQYRGAYRLDEDGHYSTYNRNRQGDMGNHDRHNDNHGGDYVYRRSRNLQDNDGYTQRQYQQSYRGDSSRQGVENNFGGRYGGSAGMRDSRSDYNERSGSSRFDNPHYGDDYVHHASSNFDINYGPDHLPYNRGENYGNMAGSLSYGYDGGYNSDPDYNRRYNPLTGELRWRESDYHQQRKPGRYGPPDLTASNPDYDRY
ncbi:hypothetical protein Q4E40_19405 [Pontibacter sp. BT731]|uniref:hypothetical protein n=1 Tax=Pontibacter coccineus TaxID=3063328 RepID=UPI0026E23BA0|nr:hypothetical protein [Pontibacter sp. BT731]MDO6392311.1 hypothetical protein [Pontibacter sp. BT731]